MKKIFTLCTFLTFTILVCNAQNNTNLINTSNATGADITTGEFTQIKVLNFIASLNSNKVTLNWTIDRNETADYFELEKSTNGKDFTTAAIVFCSEKEGAEDYMFYEKSNGNKNTFYRLKMIDKKHSFELSETIETK